MKELSDIESYELEKDKENFMIWALQVQKELKK